MAHNPVNHPLRPIYRALGGLAGVYLVVFGDRRPDRRPPATSFFGQHDDRVLGQGSQPLWSIISLILGAIVLVATVIGRNIDVAVDKYLGWGLLVARQLRARGQPHRRQLPQLQHRHRHRDATSSASCCIMAGLYSKVAPAEAGRRSRGRSEEGSHGLMAHYPVNHHLRQIYRLLAGARRRSTWSSSASSASPAPGATRSSTAAHDWVLGLRTNSAAILARSLLAGLVAGRRRGGRRQPRPPGQPGPRLGPLRLRHGRSWRSCRPTRTSSTSRWSTSSCWSRSA